MQDETVDRPRPVNPKFILGNGSRIGFDMTYVGYSPGHGGHIYRPVIEGEMAKLMPMVHGVDADEWPKDVSMQFPGLGSTTLSKEWMDRFMANSPCLRTGSTAKGRGLKVVKD